MTKIVKLRRGTTLQHSTFTGAEGETTVDTDKDCLVLHDGITVGGFEHVNTSSNQRITNKDIVATGIDVTGIVTATSFVGNVAGNATGLSGTPNITVGNIVASNVSIAGTLTYADVTNIDSVGIITARSDVIVGGGLSVTGISTLGNTVVGGATTELIVNGDARITGILTIGTASITFDGINNTVTVGSATTLDSTGFVGSGANLTSLNASNLGSGTIPNARFPATLPSASGANLTSLNASNLGSGTIPDARFPATLPAISGANLTGIFAAGTLMLFQQTTAPTGWTKQTTHNNKALRVVSGTASSGGTTAFTSVFASRTPAGSVSVSGTNSSGSVSATTLATTQIPSHSHNYYNIDSSAAAGNSGVRTNAGSGQGTATTSTGGGTSHTHGFTNPSWSGSGSFTGTAMDFAVQYVDLIIASKNA